jgi:hypothetical protein
MSIARQARLIEATKPEPFPALAQGIEAMIVIQMAAYPSGWTEDERRETAVHHLFGRAQSYNLGA